MLGDNSEPPTSEKGASIAVYLYSMGNNTPVIYCFIDKAQRFAIVVIYLLAVSLGAAQVFLCIANKEKAYVVAGFASLMEGCADNVDEDDHIH